MAARLPPRMLPTELRRFKKFYDSAASWDRVERIIDRIEAGPDGVKVIRERAVTSPTSGTQGVLESRSPSEALPHRTPSFAPPVFPRLASGSNCRDLSIAS
jgi:hypothetical protein